MLISEPYYVFPYVYWFVKRQSMMAIFSFPEHVPQIFGVFLCAGARDDAIGGNMEDSDRESQVNFNIVVLSVIIRFRQLRGSRFNVALTVI